MRQINIYYDENGKSTDLGFAVAAWEDTKIIVNVPTVYKVSEIGVESKEGYDVKSLNQHQTTFNINLSPGAGIIIGGRIGDGISTLNLTPIPIRTYGSRLM